MKRSIIAALVVFLCPYVFAKERQWQDATVDDAKTGTAGTISAASVSGGTYSASGLGVAASIPLTYYWITAGEMTYVVACVPRGTIRYKCPNITIHGKTKIAIEGRDAHILDEDGKDRKLPIMEKILNKKDDK